MKTIAAEQALLPTGWRNDVTIRINDDGHIADIIDTEAPADHRVGVILPALSNVHSHSFQRAMAGLAEQRGPNPIDDFWTWRNVMYHFLDVLTPDDIEDIAALVQLEMLEAGYASQGEFHYIHHGPDGARYHQIDETSQRHLHAARKTGIGYTHLPVLYSQAGLDGRALEGGQRRFGNDLDGFAALYAALEASWPDHPDDFALGVAPHSLRAATKEGIETCLALAPNGPIHIHAAEQEAEISEVVAALNARPVRWLLDHMPVDERWCLIHATHLDTSEIDDLAASNAVVGLCPITEANLGDGIFPAASFMAKGGEIGIGSDSNVNISLSEELRVLETSQRLRDRRRVILTRENAPSNGRMLYEAAATGGAKAIGRNSGRIEPGALADLVALDTRHLDIIGLKGDRILDAWVFASTDDLVCDVWSAGRHVVTDGQHIHRAEIASKFAATIRRLRAAF